ncbi:MAG: pirin family protein [Acidimicrobiia bacterium]|nr:pirin family protein [Acidimicrobiia bacterium]
MGERTVMATIEAHRQLEGAGFEVRRPFPTPRLAQLDPFLLLDEMGPVDLEPGAARGAPDHPHRGFETVTYMIDGATEHEDSAGHAGRIGPGGVQWMTAGAGVIHSEMPARELVTDGGRMHGFQLWVNLPRRDKMTSPHYQEFRADQIPTVTREGAVVRVIAGTFGAVTGPVVTHSPVSDFHVSLEPGAEVTVPIPSAHTALVYTFGGDGDGTLRVYAADGDQVRIVNSGDDPGEYLVLAGEPLHEPIARYGPFVMSTSEEIEQAIDDYRTGQFGLIAR